MYLILTDPTGSAVRATSDKQAKKWCKEHLASVVYLQLSPYSRLKGTLVTGVSVADEFACPDSEFYVLTPSGVHAVVRMMDDLLYASPGIPKDYYKSA